MRWVHGCQDLVSRFEASVGIFRPRNGRNGFCFLNQVGLVSSGIDWTKNINFAVVPPYDSRCSFLFERIVLEVPQLCTAFFS